MINVKRRISAIIPAVRRRNVLVIYVIKRDTDL